MRDEKVHVLLSFFTTVNYYCVAQDHSNSTPTYAAIFSLGTAHWAASHAVGIISTLSVIGFFSQWHFS